MGRWSGALKQLSLLDLLCEFRRCADRSQLLLRLHHGCLRLDRKCANAARQELAFQTLRKLASLRDAPVVDEAAPANVLSNAELVLRAFEECAAIETHFRCRSIIVRGTTHHTDQILKPRQMETVWSRFRTQNVSRRLITLSFGSRAMI